MVITVGRKMMFSRMLEPLQACEKIYNATAFSTVPNYTNLVLSKGLFTGREKIKISVSNRPAENAIISVEHGIGDQLSPKKFLKMCTVQLKKIADAREGADRPRRGLMEKAASPAVSGRAGRRRGLRPLTRSR